MERDIFADLLSGTGSAKAANQDGNFTQPAEQLPASATSRLSDPGPRTSSSQPMAADAFTDAPSSAPNATAGQPNAASTEPSVTISKAELESLLNTTVQSAVAASMSKFAHSLKTVLEDMSRRIDAAGSQTRETRVTLQEEVSALAELVESQTSNNHTRFSNVDFTLKDIERGVQSLRDKQELLEAQVRALFSHALTRYAGRHAMLNNSFDIKSFLLLSPTFPFLHVWSCFFIAVILHPSA